MNSELILVTLQGDLRVLKKLPPLKDVSVVPNSEVDLLSVSQMCKTWNSLIIFDKDGLQVTENYLVVNPDSGTKAAPLNLFFQGDADASHNQDSEQNYSYSS